MKITIQSFQELLADYNKQPSPYLDYHFERFASTLAYVRDRQAPLRILDIGGIVEFGILLSHAFPKSTIMQVQHFYSSRGLKRALNIELPNAVTGEKLVIKTYDLNAEHDTFPWENEFDLVFCMEVIEHLPEDPHNLLSQVWKSLRPGGQLILTTPNIARTQAIRQLIRGKTPYFYPKYSKYGRYGRHNREWTPTELELFCNQCGFDTLEMNTEDVWQEDQGFPSSIEEKIVSLIPSDAKNTRGQNIFYSGKKSNRPPISIDLMPEFFDIGDHKVRAGFSLIMAKRDGNSLVFEVQVANLGELSWQNSSIFILKIDADKTIVSEHYQIKPLPMMSPGEKFLFSGRVDLSNDEGIAFDLVFEGRRISETNPKSDLLVVF